ncbi:hypothetical protein AB0I28_12690 [Phytomonospora sp. NPDC050363]|uniref:hypothetical protein n=1 Tax=Phytomonospora sp. NPDC050363 TaxID=3155642 RepID=UPI0033FCBEA5
MSLKTNEPLAIRAVAVAVGAAVLAAAVSFGLTLTDVQQSAILGVVAVVAPLVAAWWARRKVTPTAKVPPAP